MRVKKTNRGFQVIEFDDMYDVPCSLQQSSVAISGDQGSSAVWFGPNDANPREFVSGRSWQPVKFPEGTLFNTRAHLDRKQVKRLVSYLQTWLECGSFTRPRRKEPV